MRVKRFIANNVQEAMQQVKQEMGSNAVILHTRVLKPSGIFGFFKKEQVEVTAALETPILKNEAPKSFAQPQTDIIEVKNQINHVQQLMFEMKSELELGHSPVTYPKNIQKLYQRMIEAQVEQKIAKRLVKKILDKSTV
ncbi:MAG: hypothetical protein SCK28_08820, partial [Bacillota bacterium]|nr:hypothetical protein [Bacillota bacterium]